MNSCKKVPVCHIQYDFEQCVAEETDGGQFYVNVDRSLNEVEEFTVKFSAGGNQFDAGEGGSFNKVDDHLYQTTLGETLEKENMTRGGVDCRFRTMDRDYTMNSHQDDEDEIQWTAIDSVGVPHELYALGNAKGDIKVYDKKLDLQREMKGAHLSDITSLRFFPSGEVLLSSSNDMQLKIWSVIDGSNPRTFAGHKSEVTDTCLIERGRNFLSSSADGTIRLWECGSGETLNVFARQENPNDGINSMALFEDGSSTDGSHPMEFGTQGKHVLAGHCSGMITLHDIFNKEQEVQLPSKFSSSCNTVATDPESTNFFYAGYQNGALAQWDLRKPLEPIDYMYINEGLPINYIYSLSKGLYISSGLDTSLKLNMSTYKSNGTIGRSILDRPTFLVSNDYRVAQCTLTPDTKHIIAVGNWGFCGKYSSENKYCK